MTVSDLELVVYVFGFCAINEFVIFIKLMCYLLQLDIQLHDRRNMSGQLEIRRNQKEFRSKYVMMLGCF